MPLTQYQLGYLAGLLDGEGTLVINVSREKRAVGKRPRARNGISIGTSLKIVNTNLDLLNGLNNIVLGKIYRSTRKKEDRGSDVFVWAINDKKTIVDILQQLLPYLIVKKDRAEKMIEFCLSRINRKSYKAGYTKEELDLAMNWSNVSTNSGADYVRK